MPEPLYRQEFDVLDSDLAAVPSTVAGALDQGSVEGGSLLESPWPAHALELMAIGGPVVWVLSAMSVFAVCIVLIKLWQFAALRPEFSAGLDRSIALWAAGDRVDAIAALNTRRPVAEITAFAMRGLITSGEDTLWLKDELQRIALCRLNQLKAYLRPLEVIAVLSPLLGLLGTVLGMIVAFQNMELAGDQVDPSVLSGGIWQALLTTAVGLLVAIPAMVLHSWLDRKVERVAALMNDAVTRVFTANTLWLASQVNTRPEGVSRAGASRAA